jgi:hypothetical protein
VGERVAVAVIDELRALSHRVACPPRVLPRGRRG